MMSMFTEDVRRDPFPLYAQMRAASPVLHVAPIDAWMLFDYASVKFAMTSHEAFSSAVVPPTGKAPDWLVFSDPPRHAHLRALILRAFTPRSIANLEPRIASLSEELLAQCPASGEIELVSQYAALLPVMVITEMLGIPSQDRVRCIRWSEAIMNLSYSAFGGADAQRAIAAHATARAEMAAYLADLVAARRATICSRVSRRPTSTGSTSTAMRSSAFSSCCSPLAPRPRRISSQTR
jgi:cytochrome P450